MLANVKLLATAGTMAVSVAAYATIWGVPFASGFVMLLLVHEMGHVIALRREGIKASAPMFIPFLGAVISARSLGDNALAEARVGLAGPILGSIGAAACLLIWHATGNDFWRALAYTGLLLNLFNLLPVVPLDGGRAMAAMTRGCGWWVRRAGGARVPLPEPDLHPRPVRSAPWRPTAVGSAAQRRHRGQAYYRVCPARPGAGRGASTWPDRAARGRHARHQPAAHVSELKQGRGSAAGLAQLALHVTGHVAGRAIDSRLSYRFLPLASAISTFARERGPEK